MANRSSKDSRSVVCSHRGYSVIRHDYKEYYYSNFSHEYTDLVKREEVFFGFCAEGDEKRPSMEYCVSERTSQKAKERIDDMLDNGGIYFTDAEREKYVRKPNRKCGWGYGYKSLMKVMNEHMKADRRMRILLEDRLTDANFHHYCGLLSKQEYEQYERDAAEEFPMRERYTITIGQMRREIKDPKGLADGLADVIDKYLQEHGIDNTRTQVDFVENW
jgi:hypothetical protein